MALRGDSDKEYDIMKQNEWNPVGDKIRKSYH